MVLFCSLQAVLRLHAEIHALLDPTLIIVQECDNIVILLVKLAKQVVQTSDSHD